NLANLGNRVADTAPVTLNTATLNFLASNLPSATSGETIGTITLASGHSTIQSGYALPAAAGVTAKLTAAALVRNPTATVNFFGNNAALGTSTTNQIVFTAPPTALLVGNGGGILPFGEVNGGSGTGDFATYGANGVTAYTAYVTSIAASASPPD